MKGKKTIPIFIAVVLISVSLFSGCVGPWAIDTLGWDHMNAEGTAVRLWGQLTVSESSDNWNEGFVWDTEYHDDWQDYLYRGWADNHAGLGLYSLNIGNLSRTTTYHYRAYGEYLKGKNEIRFGVDGTFVPGGPRVTTENASGIGLTTVTLKGTLWHMGGAPSCEVSFLYGTDQNALNLETTPETMTAIGTFDAPLIDLVTNTTYYYKAIAENDADTWSGLIFSVIPGQPVVVTRQPGEITKDHAILKGELWNTGGTAECTVWFIYSDVSQSQLDQSTPPQTMNATGAFQAYIGNLSPTTKYWYRTVASNGLAQGKGEIYEFTTTPTSEVLTTGVLGKPVKSTTVTIQKDDFSRISPRLTNLLEKYPLLMKLLQQPRIRAMLATLQ
jgi:hypothetical protein